MPTFDPSNMTYKGKHVAQMTRWELIKALVHVARLYHLLLERRIDEARSLRNP